MAKSNEDEIVCPACNAPAGAGCRGGDVHEIRARLSERKRIVAFLRSQAEDGPEPYDVERAFRLACAAIERGEHNG